MKIQAVRPILLRDEYEPNERWLFPGGGSTGWNAALLVIETDNGLTGIGESIAGATAPAAFLGMVKQLEPLLLGADPLNRQDLAARINRAGVYWVTTGIGAGVWSAVDIALWDIAGKSAGVPVYELLGGAIRREIPIYVSAGFQLSDDLLQDEMRKWRKSQFRAVKIRAFGAPEQILRTVSGARAALGDDIDLMVDLAANFLPAPYSLDQAMQIARGLHDLNVAFLEEPLRSDDVNGCAALVKASPVPIAGGENVSAVDHFELLFDKRALHLAQPDPTHCGGITAMLQIAKSSVDHSVRLAPHTWGSGVSLMASMHLIAAIRAYELAEYCGVTNRLQEALIESPLEIVNGCAQLQDSPGLGVRLTPEHIQRYGRTDSNFAPTY